MGKTTEKVITFQAGEALTKYRRVKVKTGTTTDPVQVEYADEAEQAIGVVEGDAASGAMVAVRFCDYGGSLEGIAADTFSRGASLYAADDGEISDTSSGSSIGIALEAATAEDDVVEYAPFGVLSTTAGTVSVLDSDGFTTQATVEDALAEIYQHLKSTQAFIPIPLTTWREATNFDVGDIAANGGVLASDSTPILEAINAATDGCQRVNWASGNNDQIIVQMPLPPDIDVTADVVFHCRIASESTTDAVGFTVDWFINEGDSKVQDTTTTNQTATYAEKIATLGTADIEAGAQTITIGLTPVAHTTDKMYLTATWLEYTRTLLTS